MHQHVKHGHVEPTLPYTYCTMAGFPQSHSQFPKLFPFLLTSTYTHISLFPGGPTTSSCFLNLCLSPKFCCPSSLVTGCVPPVPFAILFLPPKDLRLKDMEPKRYWVKILYLFPGIRIIGLWRSIMTQVTIFFNTSPKSERGDEWERKKNSNS